MTYVEKRNHILELENEIARLKERNQLYYGIWDEAYIRNNRNPTEAELVTHGYLTEFQIIDWNSLKYRLDKLDADRNDAYVSLYG